MTNRSEKGLRTPLPSPPPAGQGKNNGGQCDTVNVARAGHDVVVEDEAPLVSSTAIIFRYPLHSTQCRRGGTEMAQLRQQIATVILRPCGHQSST